MRFSKAVVLGMAWVLLCVGTQPAYAHKASDAFIDLRQDGAAIAVRWDIALRDLDQVLDLDTDANGTLTWGEVERQQPAVGDYALGAIHLATEAGPCRNSPPSYHVARREDGVYAVLRWRAACPLAEPEVRIQYRFLMNIDPTHRLIVAAPGTEVALKTLRPSDEYQPISLRTAAPGDDRNDLGGFFVEGFRHILYGFDHVAFLLALLIPAIAVAAVTERRLASTMGELLVMVSVFTLAHSITLGLTALNLISLPSRLVESLVALSVVVAGVHGLLTGMAGADHVTTRGRSLGSWRGAVPLWIVFAFGLIHGIGFGAALGGAGFGGRTALSALLGFNLGVEAGQLAVLAVAFPLAWALKSGAGFRRVLLPGAAIAIVLAGVLWFVARAFDVHIAEGLFSS
ncbi:MAG: HupE/UreJ family protein [Lautropia sp.]|nr:HupE/UreJ family protein [Lautropia sp.]